VLSRTILYSFGSGTLCSALVFKYIYSADETCIVGTAVKKWSCREFSAPDIWNL